MPSITWDLPEVSSRQRPIKQVLVEARTSDEFPWAPAGNPVPVDGPQEFNMENMDPGAWFFRLVVVDEADVRSPNPPEFEFGIDFDPPGNVSNVEFHP